MRRAWSRVPRSPAPNGECTSREIIHSAITVTIRQK